MSRDRRAILVLDCACVIWCQERRREIARKQKQGAARRSEAHPFTFSDIPPALVGGDVEVVLEPHQGVKS